MKNRKLKSKRINYKRVGVLLLVILGGVVGMVLLLGNNETLSHGEITYKTVCVSSGETLWDISKIELANNNYYESKDVRYVINEIKKINHLETSDLSIGQMLKVPVI